MTKTYEIIRENFLGFKVLRFNDGFRANHIKGNKVFYDLEAVSRFEKLVDLYKAIASTMDLQGNKNYVRAMYYDDSSYQCICPKCFYEAAAKQEIIEAFDKETFQDLVDGEQNFCCQCGEKMEWDEPEKGCRCYYECGCTFQPTFDYK